MNRVTEVGSSSQSARNPPEPVLLISSNSEKKYILDAFQAVALPRMSVQHFRYRLAWVDPNLAASLPTRDANQSGKTFAGSVIIAYLYQEADKGRWNWIALYPTRRGTLLDAYKTGSGPDDVAHFYFRLENHFDYAQSPQDKFLGDVLAQLKEQRYYAMYTLAEVPPTSPAQSDESAVIALSSAIKREHLRTSDVDHQVQYYAMFLTIRSLSVRRGFKTISISPSYDANSHNWYYEVPEASRCLMNSSYIFPAAPPDPQSTIAVRASSTISVFRETVDVTSRYDEFTSQLEVASVAENHWSALTLVTKFKSPNKGEESLDLSIPIQFLIRSQSVSRKVVSIFSALKDIFLAAGTAWLSIWAVTSRGLLLDLAIVAYLCWIASTLILVFWKR